ncbi:MAG: M28 family peptidase [Bacteroidales bacterium]|jgi:hypothetical protein|nr:M28 family peptidase [Bacteroidales bacterium]
MRAIFILLIFLIFNSASAQRLINNKGNRNQTYPQVTAVDPNIKQLLERVSIENLEASIRWMQEIGIRDAASPPALETQNWLVDQFESFGLNVSTHHFAWWGDTLDAGNVLAIQPGTIPRSGYIIVSSHYDHPDGPGADDNASGTAGVLEIARILSAHKFQQTIVYLPFNAEEYWMVGSLPFVEMNAEHDMNILGCFNLDMLGFFPENMGALTMSSGSSYISNRLWEYYCNVANLYVPEIPTFKFTNGDAYGGDHMPFNIYEYPALYIGDIEYHDLHPCYHKPCDTLGNGVNSLELVQGFTRATLAAVAELANGSFPPQNLSAISTEEGIKISWDSVEGVNRYRLFKNNALLTETFMTWHIDQENTLQNDNIYHAMAVHPESGETKAVSNSDSMLFSPPLQLPYFNNFEENAIGWRTSSSWNIQHDNGNGYLTNNGTYVSENYLTIAELQWFSLPDTVSHATLSFDLKTNIHGMWKASNLFAEVTTDRKRWHKLMIMSGDNNWTSCRFSLDKFIGEPFVQVRFRIESSGQHDMFFSKSAHIDNVSVNFDYTPQYPPPENVQVTAYDQQYNSAEITWDKTAWVIGYNVFRDSIQINNALVVTTDYIDIEAHSPDVCYQVTAVYETGESDFSEKACIKDFIEIENIDFMKINIAPNPTSGIMNITTGLNRPYHIAVYNIQGIKLFQKEHFTDGVLNISHLSKGVYILKLGTDEHAFSKKIIIQ